MKTVIETITPKVAENYLKHNKNNYRTLTESGIQNFQRLIRSGNFYLHHQGIAFDTNDNLSDGQHRLHAIVRENATVQMMVTRGVKPESAKGMDCGRVRKNFERLHIIDDERGNRTIVQAISRYIAAARRINGQIPVDVIEEEFLARAESWQWVASQYTTKSRVYSRGSVLAALAIYHSCDAYMAQEFSDKLISGANLEPSSPILALRHSLELTPPHLPSNYWKTMAAIRAHLDRRPLMKIMEATEDLIGNKNSQHLIRERSARAIKAGQTRKAKGLVA